MSMDWQGHKQAGNDAIQRNPALAFDSYTRAISLLPPTDGTNLAILYGNRAFASMKQGQFSRALTDCNLALAADATYDKAQLRRAQVRRQLGELQGAIDDFKAVLTTSTHEPTYVITCAIINECILILIYFYVMNDIDARRHNKNWYWRRNQ